MKKSLILLAIILIAALLFIMTYTPSLSEQHGQLATKLYIGDSTNQPLIVAFGGGGGGNDWARGYMKEKRAELLKRGYAVLAIGYFNAGVNTPPYLDRISLNAIADTILTIASRNKNIDENKIALMGGSKGGELVLNLASRYKAFNAVIAMSTADISFPAITLTSNTSSWMYDGQEVAYVPAPLKIIVPAIKGDLFTAFNMMLEDEQAVEKAAIAVEHINGPILILSADKDEQWPAAFMSNRLIERLKEKGFTHKYEHLLFEGSHVEPLNHFDKVYNFLAEAYPAE